jgi:uncharacterized membrane protein
MTGSEPTIHSAATAILAMAGVTYLMRVSGYWIIGRFQMTPRVRRMLEALPGCIVMATIVPIALSQGPAAMLAIVGAALVMAISRSDFVAVLAGVAAAALARAAGL